MRRVAVVGAADEEGPVSVDWDPLPDGHQLPVWKPA